MMSPLSDDGPSVKTFNALTWAGTSIDDAFMPRLAGKVCLVTGGAGGAGAAATLLFAAEKAAVGIIDLPSQADAAAALVQEVRDHGGRAAFAAADVSCAAQVDAAVAALAAERGPPTLLFAHAGTLLVKPFLETRAEEWDALFAVNVRGMFWACKAALPFMVAAGGGAIVCTSSISAELGTPCEVAYGASKGACHQLARALAVEFRDRGVRANAVCPGFIRTPHGLREQQQLLELGVDVSDAGLKAAQGRWCEPREVAQAALWLLSDDASFVNGARLFVDNGFSSV